MAAIMQIHEMTASMAGINKTRSTIRFKLADNTNVNYLDPIIRPTSGAIHSYSKQLRLYCSTAPDVQVSNLRAYTDGASNFGTGVSVAATNYSASCGDPHVWVDNNQTVISASTNLFTKTAGSPMDLDAVHTAAVTTTGYCGDILKLMLSIDTNAAPGLLRPETLTFAYDET